MKTLRDVILAGLTHSVMNYATTNHNTFTKPPYLQEAAFVVRRFIASVRKSYSIPRIQTARSVKSDLSVTQRPKIRQLISLTHTFLLLFDSK